MRQGHGHALPSLVIARSEGTWVALDSGLPADLFPEG